MVKSPYDDRQRGRQRAKTCHPQLLRRPRSLTRSSGWDRLLSWSIAMCAHVAARLSRRKGLTCKYCVCGPIRRFMRIIWCENFPWNRHPPSSRAAIRCAGEENCAMNFVSVTWMHFLRRRTDTSWSFSSWEQCCMNTCIRPLQCVLTITQTVPLNPAHHPCLSCMQVVNGAL